MIFIMKLLLNKLLDK